jgi:hypothetical protein
MSEEIKKETEDLNLEIQDETSFNQEALENLLDFDFSSEEDFNLEESYKWVNEFEEAQQKARISAEDNTISNLGPQYIDKEYFDKIEQLRGNIRSFIKKYSANTDYIKELLDKNDEESEKTLDKLFAICTFLLKTYKETVSNLFFVFKMTKKEYNMINDIVMKNSTVVGSETLLEGMDELITYLQEWNQIYKNTQGDILELPISIGSTVLLYHFLSKKTVKGFSDAFYTLRSIMFKLKEANDVHHAYKTLEERLNQDYTIWTGSITPFNKEKETIDKDTPDVDLKEEK